MLKWLASESKILLLDEPTRGIDVGSKLEFYKLILRWSVPKKSIILFPRNCRSYMPASDRILVMSNSPDQEGVPYR